MSSRCLCCDHIMTRDEMLRIDPIALKHEDWCTSCLEKYKQECYSVTDTHASFIGVLDYDDDDVSDVVELLGVPTDE